MCGITGCLALADGAGPDTEWVGRAAMRIAHRGPDDEDFFADHDLALGFRRLAVIDTSAAGRQPMQSADGRFVMVFDGEIYNYVELAQRLLARGVRLRSRSAAEVLLEMYAWLGRDVVRQLRGMYAFAIWDRRTRELFCARDPFGIKPFFYALTTGGHRPRSGPQLRFASERKALADSGEVTAIDPDALRRYLSFQYVPAPATLVPPARSLPPGHVLIAKPGGRVDVFRYWRPELRPARSPSSSSPDKILAALRDSVAVHLRSDVPVGAFLSGGVDSATLCALAAESVPGLLTFTVGFEREGYNEIDDAMATATALGVKSVPYVIGPEEFLACLPRIIWHLDDPMADAAAVPLWFAAREARKHVKVVLSGEGADELFGGYGVYHQPGVVRAGQVLPGWGRATIGRVASELPAGARGKGFLNRTSTPLRRRYIGNAYVYHGEEARHADPAGQRQRVRRDRSGVPAGGRRRPGRRGHHAADRRQHLAARRHPGQGRPDEPWPTAWSCARRSWTARCSRWRRGWPGWRRPPRAPPSSRSGRPSASCCPRPPRSARSWASRCRSAPGSAAACMVSRSRWSARRRPASG